MHRTLAPSAALMVAALLSLPHACPGAHPEDADNHLRSGREALARGDGPAAASLLESALLSASATDRPAVLEDLRNAYRRAAAQAEAAGDARRARAYRENLLIIDRSRSEPSRPSTKPAAERPGTTPRPPSTTAPESPPVPPPAIEPPAEVESPASQDPEPAEAPHPEVQSPSDSSPTNDLPPTDKAIAPASNSVSEQVAEGVPEATKPTPAPATIQGSESAGTKSPAEFLRAADAAFREQKFDEAGRLYATLAEQGELPEAHRPVWAYCRFVAVARKINAQPSTPAEWSAIHSEIREVRALAPEIWFSEYLRRLAAERSAASGARPSAFIVRGQSDAEQPSPAVPSNASVGSWKVMETENFRVFHADPVLADRIARRAERARSELLRYWTGSEPPAPWSPRCDLYLYPDAITFSRRTGQPADSPGFSTMGLRGGRVVARRINLRADHDGLVQAVLPHEVAHVVLADLFPDQQIPRWADEGIAVLAEPDDAQASRLAHLDVPLASGRVFRSDQLMTASMPDGRYWDLFMAQSASLARYLIQLDSPDRLVSFLRQAERLGVEPALQRVYGFEGFDDLHSRWLSHSRNAASSVGEVASRPDEEADRAR